MDSVPSLEEVPVGSLDAAWEGRAAEVDGAVRVRWLAEADRLRGRDGPARRRALACYRAFASRLDPRSPEDAGRIRWALENDRERDGTVAVLASAAERTADPEVRELAAVVLGQVAADAGRLPEAERRFRALLEGDPPAGDRTQRWACLSLAKVYAHQRRGFEALVLARHAADLARRAGNPWDLCVARARICMALQVVDDAERLALAVDELERALDEVPPERALPLRAMVHAFRAEAALETMDLDAARRALAALRGIAPPDAPFPGDARLPAYLEAEIELRSGDPAAALRAAARARALPARIATSDLPLGMLEARALLRTGDAAAARARAREVLDLLDRERDPDPLGTGQRIRYAVEAGRFLQEECGDADGARRAFDLAAGCVVRRIVEIDRTVAELPRLEGIAQEDLKVLTEHRDRHVREQREILDRVAALFAGGPPPELAAPRDDGEEAEERYFLACAWCRRVRNAAGRWLPIGHFLPEDRNLRISHGICHDCHRRWLERMARGQE